MLEHLEQQKKLTVNQWKIFAAATIGDMLDFFDFLLIAFVLAFIVKDWNLTYGESGAILLASGISAPLGSLFYGWLADKIGRRKVMIITILNFSIATGLMALTPEHGWVFLVICRVLVGFGVTGLYTVDIAVVQEFVPAYRRGWITGVTTTMLPAGFLLGALLGQYVEAYVGWRGLFAIGLLPAALSLLIRAWVPESPHWLIRVGRLAEARQSLAWALMVDPREIQLPAVAPPVEPLAWRELFKYPRSVAAGCLAGLSGTGITGFLLWQVTLFVMVLHVTPAQAFCSSTAASNGAGLDSPMTSPTFTIGTAGSCENSASASPTVPQLSASIGWAPIITGSVLDRKLSSTAAARMSMR